MRSVFLLALFALPLFAEIPLTVGPLRAQGRYFRDARGGVVLLRGVNVSGAFKSPPVKHKFQASHLDPLPGWGINTIRLLFNWESFEPVKGKYDVAYLEWYANLVREVGRRGLGVVVDLHQDAFSRFAMDGCGDGFPRWAVVGPLAQPDNGPACADWGDRQILSPQVKASYDAFYADANGVRTRYVALWQRVAERFRREPAVIGYDLLNEPTRGDWDSQLLPLYTDAARAIRAVDPTKILFLEPVAGRVSLGPGMVISPRMRKPEFDNFAFAPHFYDLQMLGLGRHLLGWWSDFSEIEISDIERTAGRWNVPVWIGEFGHPKAGADLELARRYLEGLYAQWNRRFFSAMEWSYIPTWTPARQDDWNAEDASIVDNQGNLRHFRPRPHAVRIAGTPVKMEDRLAATTRRTQSFTLEWENDPSAGETVAFAPQAIFPAKPVLEVWPPEAVCAYDSGARVICRSARAGNHRLVIRSSEAR